MALILYQDPIKFILDIILDTILPIKYEKIKDHMEIPLKPYIFPINYENNFPKVIDMKPYSKRFKNNYPDKMGLTYDSLPKYTTLRELENKSPTPSHLEMD